MFLKDDVKYIKGVGPKRSEILAKLDIKNIWDLLLYFPRSYQDRRLIKDKKIPEIDDVDVASGEVFDFYEIQTSSSLKIFKIFFRDENKEYEANIFKNYKRNFDVFMPIKKKIRKGIKVYVVGRIESNFFRSQINVDEIYFEGDEDLSINFNRIVPIYSLTSGIDIRTFRRIIYNAISNLKEEAVYEIIPDYIIKKRNLFDRYNALINIHFPKDIETLKKSRDRFIYEELFLMGIAWGIKKRQTREIIKKRTYEIKRTLLTPFKNNMGFEFTLSQKRAINEIFKDMRSPYPMARLLCGDVGSGKTVVAISACLLAVENNYQACFIAPTEILAEQHYITFKKFLYGLNLKFEVLTSGTPKKKKQEILEGLINGEIDIIVGTHSLMEENVRFKNLALVIIDEQHRFGVRQRATVRKKGDRVDILVMTATPIPRTLFLALYGDLDLSVLTDMPPGKGKIMTFHTDEKTAFDEAKKQIEKGFQVYIVFPVIEESSKKEIKSLLKEYERIKDIFAPNKVSFIHGSMSSKEKQSIMQEFANGDIKVLCATPIIEVGIDVPNATVMIIENAERFGIASLHQLRGRVGRGRNDGYCFLISDVRSGDAYERIKALCETTNGFELSEKDAYIRGVGEILGTKQHGDIEFRIASIYRDKEIFSMVLEDKEKILLDDPYLRDFSNYRLKKEVFEIYGEKWNIVDMS